MLSYNSNLIKLYYIGVVILIVLLSPAKTFNKTYLNTSEEILFKDKHNYLLNILKSFTKEDLKNHLKLSDNLTNKAYLYYNDFNNNILAISLYGGHAFKHLNYKNLKSYDNIYILSPLYGLIKGSNAISKYRLDLKDKY